MFFEKLSSKMANFTHADIFLGVKMQWHFDLPEDGEPTHLRGT